MGDSDSDSDRSYDYLDYDEEDNTPRSPGSPTAQDRRARVSIPFAGSLKRPYFVFPIAKSLFFRD
jgi:hypothetical protein